MGGNPRAGSIPASAIQRSTVNLNGSKAAVFLRILPSRDRTADRIGFTVKKRRLSFPHSTGSGTGYRTRNVDEGPAEPTGIAPALSSATQPPSLAKASPTTATNFGRPAPPFSTANSGSERSAIGSRAISSESESVSGALSQSPQADEFLTTAASVINRPGRLLGRLKKHVRSWDSRA